jgi:hypothetical protein
VGVAEEGGKVATATVDSLKSQPLALALIVVNVLFLIGGGYTLHDVANRMQVREEKADVRLGEVLRHCFVAVPLPVPRPAEPQP